MKTKQCFKCKQEKPLGLFYKHPQMADGHLGKCIECTKKDVCENRAKNLGRIRAYDRQRAKLPHRRKNSLIISKRWRSDPEKRGVASKVARAVRSGAIKKSKQCEECGEGGLIHGHHEDYSKPLDIVWLCPACHSKRTQAA